MDDYARLADFVCSEILKLHDLKTAEGRIECNRFDRERDKALSIAAAITTLLADRDAALKRERVLREALIASREFLKHAPLESGYCCCGDKIEAHNIGSGHSPVDMLQYAVEQEIQRVSAALSASGKQEVSNAPAAI